MSVETDIYDYFTPIENAIAAAFHAHDVICYTPLGKQGADDADDLTPDQEDPDFQRERPRIEIALMPGAGMGRLRVSSGRQVANGHLREMAYRSALNIEAITKADIREHRSYLCRILFLCDTLAHDVNNTALLYNHKLQRIQSTGGSVEYKPEDGLFRSLLTYDVDFSVQQYAFEALEATLT